MLMTIRYQGGMRAEAVLLAANCERMRLAVAFQRDTIELHEADGCWYTEKGDVIELEALIPFAGTDFAGFCAEVPPGKGAGGPVFQSACSVVGGDGRNPPHKKGPSARPAGPHPPTEATA